MLDSLPDDISDLMSNVAVVVEDEPPPGLPLLGLYSGVPLTRRTSWYGNVPPDKITIYQDRSRGISDTIRSCCAARCGGLSSTRSPTISESAMSDSKKSTDTDIAWRLGRFSFAIALQLLVAILSEKRGWHVWTLPWWIWLVLIVPEVALLASVIRRRPA